MSRDLTPQEQSRQDMMIQRYNQGITPRAVGVYAVRVPSPHHAAIHEDKFLIWLDNQWGYLSSDQQYRGEVVGWIGPLERTNNLKDRK